MWKCFIVGRLVDDPVSKTITTAKGEKTLTTFSLAVSEGNAEPSYVDNITAWERQAETIMKFVKKGDPILVVTECRNRKIETADHSKRTVQDHRVTDFQLMSRRTHTEDESAEAVKAEAVAEVAAEAPPF